MFLGYSHKKKGYWVYFSYQHKYGVSTDVTFFESAQYFSFNSSTISIPYSYFILFVLSSRHISSTYHNGSCTSLITISTIIAYPLLDSIASPYFALC